VGVCCFARRLVRGGGVVMGLDRVLVGFGRVLMGFLVIGLDVVLGCQEMMLLLRGAPRICDVLRVPFLIVLWEISRRDPTRPPVKTSLPVAEDSHGLQEIHGAKKNGLPFHWEAISFRARLI
jgi:hypothetical protein